MSLYEHIFIARQEISPAQVEALTDNFSNILVENGGSVLKREQCGLRTLTYKIKKNRKGYYVLLNIDAPAAAIHEMERQMRLHEDVLRHMTISVDKIEEGPSALLRQSARRYHEEADSEYSNPHEAAQ